MKSLCDKNTIEIIGLKRPTALDKLAESISKPKGAIPNFGLPKWKVMPLESKIPMVPGPEGVYNFTRRKVGRRLWVSAPDAEFNLSDPYCYEMNLIYDPLHDKHLVPFFSKPNNIRNLVKAGLITKTLDAKCSLRDYNMYRKYLRKLHCDSIKKELRKRSRWEAEERALKYADQMAQKEVKKLKDREKLVEARRVIIKRRKLAEKLKRKKQKENQWKMQQRLENLALEKHEARKAQFAMSKARAEIIQQKRKAAADIERRKIVQTLVEWSKKERVRKKMQQVRLAHEREQKLKIVEQKWIARQEFQKKQIEKEQFLLRCVEDQRKQFIQDYNDKINRETERMKRLLEDMKIFIRCYMARRAAGSKEQICCEKYFNSDRDEAGGDMKRLTSMPQPKPTTTYEKDKANNNQIKESKREKKLRNAKPVAKSNVGAKQTGSKRKKRKSKKSEKKELVIESEEKQSWSDATQESESMPKATEASESSESESTPKDKCRCQMIKANMQSAAT